MNTTDPTPRLGSPVAPPDRRLAVLLLLARGVAVSEAVEFFRRERRRTMGGVA